MIRLKQFFTDCFVEVGCADWVEFSLNDRSGPVFLHGPFLAVAGPTLLPTQLSVNYPGLPIPAMRIAVTTEIFCDTKLFVLWWRVGLPVVAALIALPDISVMRMDCSRKLHVRTMTSCGNPRPIAAWGNMVAWKLSALRHYRLGVALICLDIGCPAMVTNYPVLSD